MGHISRDLGDNSFILEGTATLTGHYASRGAEIDSRELAYECYMPPPRHRDRRSICRRRIAILIGGRYAKHRGGVMTTGMEKPALLYLIMADYHGS